MSKTAKIAEDQHCGRALCHVVSGAVSELLRHEAGPGKKESLVVHFLFAGAAFQPACTCLLQATGYFLTRCLRRLSNCVCRPYLTCSGSSNNPDPAPKIRMDGVRATNSEALSFIAVLLIIHQTRSAHHTPRDLALSRGASPHAPQVVQLAVAEVRRSSPPWSPA